MKGIFSEFCWRLYYLAMLLIGFHFILYFSVGTQLEYLSALFSNHYQFVEFCFESFLWQWFGTGKFKSKDLEINRLNLLVYQSKSWSFLNLASMIYFNHFDLDKISYFFVIWNEVNVNVIGFCLFQIHAFLLPGFPKFSRQILWLEFLLLGLVYSWGFELTCDFAWLINEFNMECFDSELLQRQKGNE